MVRHVKLGTEEGEAPKWILSSTDKNSFDLDSMGRVPYIRTSLVEGVVNMVVGYSNTFPGVACKGTHKTARAASSKPGVELGYFPNARKQLVTTYDDDDSTDDEDGGGRRWY
jgi:hypothetical protein